MGQYKLTNRSNFYLSFECVSGVAEIKVSLVRIEIDPNLFTVFADATVSSKIFVHVADDEIETIPDYTDVFSSDDEDDDDDAGNNIEYQDCPSGVFSPILLFWTYSRPKPV